MVKDREFYKKISKIGLEKRWKKEHSKVRISKTLSKEKIAINAYLCGDGNIVIRKDKNKDVHYDIRIFLDHIYLAKRILVLFKKEFNIEPKIRALKNYFKVEIKNKPTCINLMSLGSYGHYKWNVPKRLSRTFLREWIKCFFDCEAYINKFSRAIQVKSVNFRGLLDIKDKLKFLKINSKVYGPYKQKNANHNDYGMLVISRKGELLKYKKFINFYHPDKRENLNKILY